MIEPRKCSWLLRFVVGGKHGVRICQNQRVKLLFSGREFPQRLGKLLGQSVSRAEFDVIKIWILAVPIFSEALW